jgi:SAM-dependent methyltransferase
MGIHWPYRRASYRRLQKRARRVLRPAWLGTLRRVTPLSQQWGYDRGTPVDRYYIERFLERHCHDIRGRVLEVKDSTYTERWGCGVTSTEVLDIDPNNPRATVVADLGVENALEGDAFDCCVIVQTLLYVPDPAAAVRTLWRALRPGGVLLLTVPGITRVDPILTATDYWRFTPAVCRRLLGESFGNEHVEVEGHGNVLAAIAFLTGMGHEELSRRELDVTDPSYPLIITARAMKASGAALR